ncbi:MAG: transpeptidase family protein [Deltaproteobacteria bacterium]|nr:transpeptidase family protein [Deltaproteobacteria bacterium]MBW2016704.1 transpeptidase family protein [Deltaproteobacteria bacterium]MBW2302467.1 transpeptidase family protein [Deltaproteobacteria bacterium]
MQVREKKWIRFRILLVAFFFLGGLGTILARAYQLQVLQKDRLASIARAGYRGVIRLPPKRGTICDREGHELAVSVEVDSIYAHPKRVKNKLQTASRLSKVIGIPRSKLLGLLKSKRAFVWIQRKVPPEKVEMVKALELEGIGFARESRRYYPGREIGGQLIGFVGDDNQGLEGLERKYDDLLKGPQPTLIQMRDALGRPFYVSMPADEKGRMYNLRLTIDKDIQYKAERALQATVEKYRAKSGHCIVVDPRTGEILAMAVVPLFNPNVFRRYGPARWRNRPVTDTYEPGSTMKAFLLASALENHVVSPQTTFYCEEGKFQVGGRTIHDTKPHGLLTVSDIVILSSNIGAVKIGQKLGYRKFTDYLKKFGFGRETGIDLLGEARGFIRPYEKTRAIDRATIFYGHGLSVTSLQMTMAMAAIANGGKLMKPYVVKEITDQQGRVVKRFHPKVVRRVLSEGTARKVARILEGVVSEKGTAPLAGISGYRVAGKTGTSRKLDPKTKRYSRRNYMASFVGFVPASRPRLVIFVAVDEPRGLYYGGSVAAPVFREVGAWALNLLRVNPRHQVVMVNKEVAKIRDSLWRPESMEEGGGREKEEEGCLPDFRGLTMREVLTRATSLGLKVVLEGTGLAASQRPLPGRPLDSVSAVKVTFRPPM